MLRATIFACLLVLVSLYALMRGGAPERCGVVAYLLAYVVSVLATYASNQYYSSVEWGIFAVDIVLLFALVGLALRANRVWTIWAASLQTVAVTAHLVKFVVPEVLASAYAATLIVWSYAMLPMLVAATIRHRKRIAEFGSDSSWTTV